MKKERGVKNISQSIKKIRHIHKYNDSELESFLKNEIEDILEAYSEEQYKRKIISEFISLIMDKLKPNSIDRISKQADIYLREEFLNDSNKVIFSFLKSINKNIISNLRGWIRSIRILGIYQYEIIEFIIAASIVNDGVDKYGVIKDKKIISVIQGIKDESKCTNSYLKLFKTNKYLGILKICDVFDFINSAYLYNEDVLDECIALKRKYNYLCTYYGIFDVFEYKCRKKFATFYSENITSLEVENANKRYNFKWKKVNDVVFIESLIDDWYVMVDKVRGRMTLYHNNNIGVDTFHVQRVFRHTDLKKVFRTIHNHDVYSLRRFDALKARA